MKSWSLDQLESSVPESVWLEAEALLDRQAVRELECDNGKCTAMVLSGSESFSVYGKLSRNKMLSHGQCECEQFKKKDLCAHWIAFALNLRSDLAAQKGKQPTPNFDMELIGREIPFPNLWTFVRQYAKKDKFLEWQLKARFARHISVLDESKYKKLLDQVLPPSQEAKKRKPHKRFRQTIQIIKILRDEALDALALNEYMEAFLIAESAVPKLCILLRDQDAIDPVTLELFNYFIDFTRKIYEEPIPNPLRSRLIKWSVDISCRSYFPNKRGHEHLYEDIAKWIDEKEEYWDDCLEQLNIKYGYAQKVGQEVAFIAQSHALYYVIDQGESVYPFLEEMKQYLDKGQQLLHYAQYHLPPERSAPLFRQMAEIWKETTLERIIHESLFHVFSLMKEPGDKIYWAKQLLQQKFIPECYEALVNSNGQSGMNTEDFVSWMEDEVLPALDEKQKTVYRSAYLSHMEDWSSLKDLIATANKRLVRKYDEQLFEHSPENAIDLYQGMLIEYLKDHHGPSASYYLAEIKQRLLDIDAIEYWKEITEKVLEIYGDRGSVISGIFES